MILKQNACNALMNPKRPTGLIVIKSSVGYDMDVIETRKQGKNLSMTMHYENQPNILSDTELGSDTLSELTGISTLASDGSFNSKDYGPSSWKEGVNFKFLGLKQQAAATGKITADQFVIDPDTVLISTWLQGIRPVFAIRDHEKELVKI